MDGKSLRRKIRAVNLALWSTAALSLAKIIVSVSSGSVSILSEAIHSGLDLLSSIMTRIAVTESAKPADEGHPFGHGKLENLSALFESFLLIVAGIYIVFEAIHSFNHGREVQNLGWALIVVFISMAMNIFVYFQNRNVAIEEESVAIETNAYHFLTDFFTSFGLFLSLVLLKYTRWQWIDPAAALALSVYIFIVAYQQIRKCVDQLADKALPEPERAEIESIVLRQCGHFQDFHDLKTRKVGAIRHIDMHLTVCSELRVKHAHDICDHIEGDIQERFKDAHVSIHIEPCDHHTPECRMVCTRFQKGGDES